MDLSLRAARKQWGRQRLHPATKTFLALRIAVNREMEELGQFLSRTARRTFVLDSASVVAAALLFFFALVIGGCAMRHVQVRGEVVIPNDCIIELKATEKTACHGPDGKNIRCENVQLTHRPDCETFEVKPKKHSRPSGVMEEK